ncbi:hypothetical protein DVH24_030249 [Malus domestica]|uniref:Uncharacterized protein n=1 Tax=Malus domestica TaxID=3750 RepID=A0A498HVB2_MALDO|nr:hypothetical protein DVH24_030249 [Malus domestica]
MLTTPFAMPSASHLSNGSAIYKRTKIQELLQKRVDPKPKIALELSKMDLSIGEQIKALNILFEKPQNERTFLSLDGAMKKILRTHV